MAHSKSIPLDIQVAEAQPAFQSSGAAGAPAIETRSPSVGIPELLKSGEAVQVAARLTLMLASGQSFIAMSGIKQGDGCSRLTATLGSALATLDSRPVLIVDANLRNSTVSALFGLTGSTGLLNVLEGKVELKQAIQPVAAIPLSLLPPGHSNQSLASLVNSPRCAEVLEACRQHYRYVLIDCGTVCDSPDNMLLASKCDGVVAAVAAGRRRRSEVQDFERTLRNLRIPLLGVVLTREMRG